MVRRALLSCLIALAGCAQVRAPDLPPIAAEPTLLRDDAFAAPSQRIDVDAILRASREMQDFVASPTARVLREEDPRRALIDMLYQKRRLAIDYDSSVTRNAAQTFEARAGNCLSLVIMTASFAKLLGLPVRFQRVMVDEAWTRSGDLYFASGHVNLTLDITPFPARFVRGYEPPMVVDFLPASELARTRTQPITEETLLAMYLNNRAAESMAAGALDEAYAHASAAVRQDPRFLAAYNTLGVVYLRRGLAADAERVFSTVLRHEPENPKAMGNRVVALRALGRHAEATALAATLARIEPTPPFHWFNLGLAAMRERDYERARDLFAREVRREAYYHEFRFWLAQAELALGHVAAAREQLELARQSSTTPRDQGIYAAKLARLNGLPRQQ